MGASGLSTRPGTKPKNETREIIRLTQSRQEIYPKITPDNFDKTKYKDLIDPLRANPGNLSKIQKDFLVNMQSVENMLKGVVLSDFSYAKAKTSAQGADMARFSQLERKITMVQTAQATPVGNPNKELLFGAQTQTEFNTRMSDPNIVQAVYSADTNFKARAQRVFDFVQKFRKKHSKELKDQTVDAYLQDIFNNNKDKIETSTIIKSTLLSPTQKAEVGTAYDKYHLYRKRFEKQLGLEKLMKKERKTFLSKPVAYAKSGERWGAEKIQTMRDHWAGMDGKEKFIAGLTILVGTAWFLNSENEGIQKARSAMMKAGLIAVGYIGINTTSKVLFGKSISQKAGSYIEDRSGKRDYLKDSFNTDKAGADNIQTSLAVLGNHDFLELSDMYLKEDARYKKFHTQPGVSVGGVAEKEMSPNTIYKTMTLVDKKLRKNNSSIAKLHHELAKAKASAHRQGKAFVAPTWAMILTAILQNQKLGYKIDKKTGKIAVTTQEAKIETTWENTDKQRTKHWWPITGRPKDWRMATVDKTPKISSNGPQLKKLSSSIIPSNKPLGGMIHTDNFGRYTRGFNAAYVTGYSKRPAQAVHKFEDTGEKATYITSKIKVDTATHRSKTAAQVAAIQGAYQQTIKNLKDEIARKPNHPLKNVKNRLNEFVHPVFGTFIGPSKNAAKEYVMFLRLTLPGSLEHKLRKAHEWPEGNMIQQKKEKQLITGDKLTRGDFQTLGKKPTVKLFGTNYPKIKAFGRDFGGAYESFLAKVRLNKGETNNIDKILEYYSKRFSNSGLTKRGLVRYLATHKFTDAEIKKALGLSASATLSNSVDLYSGIRQITLNTTIKKPTLANKAYIINSIGNMTVLACYGDNKALNVIGLFDPMLKQAILLYRQHPATNIGIPNLYTQYALTITRVYNKDDAIAKDKRKKIKFAADQYYKV